MNQKLHAQRVYVVCTAMIGGKMLSCNLVTMVILGLYRHLFTRQSSS